MKVQRDKAIQRDKARFMENLARNIRDVKYSARLIGRESEAGRIAKVSNQEVRETVEVALGFTEGADGLVTIIEHEIIYGGKNS